MAPREEAVLACLPHDDAGAARVLDEARRIARALEAPLRVVCLYPEGWTGALRPLPGAWHLRTGRPEGPVRRFAELTRSAVLVGLP